MVSHRGSSIGSALSFLSFDSTTSVAEEDEARNDMEGLVQLMTQLRQEGIRLREVTYVINRWSLGGIIPMTHHGFIFRTSRGGSNSETLPEFFTLDFGRKGIVWDVMDESPDLPDNTFYTKLYNIDMDTFPVQKYCQETPPFNYPFYDCESWAKGMLAALNLDKAPGRISKDMCAPSLGQAASGYGAQHTGYGAQHTDRSATSERASMGNFMEMSGSSPSPVSYQYAGRPPANPVRKQRTGTCI